jgi:prepilin-type N-terminal cleavage/methylation domain-containing protein
MLKLRLKSFWKALCRRVLLRSTVGFTLIEVVIAIAVLAFMTASVPRALIMVTNNQFRWNEQRTAENLTRNQIEYVKVTQYIAGNITNPLPQYNLVPKPSDNWSLQVVAQPIDPVTYGNLTTGQDKGLQRITVSVYHVNKLILQTVDNKGNGTEIWRPPV